MLDPVLFIVKKNARDANCPFGQNCKERKEEAKKEGKEGKESSLPNR
jgi:hypothetical protein